MNLNQLRIFHAAARHGGVSAAAEALFITQPAVSKGLQQFERDCGMKFFNRFGKKMVLTDAGEALYEVARKLFQLETQAEELIQDFQQGKAGHLRLHTCESFGGYYLPSILNRFSKDNPGIRVLAHIWPSEQVVRNVANLDADLGFISFRVEHERLLVEEVMEDRLVVIAPLGHPLAERPAIRPAELEGESLVSHEPGSGTRMVVDRFLERHELGVEHRLELSNNEAIKMAVIDGVALSIISRHIVKAEVEAGKLRAIPVEDPELRRRYFVVRHRDKYISQHLAGVLDMIRQWAEGPEFERDR